MLSLRNLLSTAGMVSGKELITLYGANLDFQELTEMIENKEVSVHLEPLGGKNYRYPYYEPRTKNDGSEKMFELIRDRPWMNAKTIREVMEISQASFERWEAELIQEGRITRTKRGVAWLYSAGEIKAPVVSKVSIGAWYVFFEHMQDDFKPLSLQQMAKNYRCSREVITEGQRWLTEHGILVGETLGGYWAKSVEERKSWLLETFPNPPESFGPWEDWKIDDWTMTKGVDKIRSPTQPDELGELGRLILEILGKGKMSTAEIAQSIPGAETPGPLREEVRRKVLSMMDSGLLSRDWWPQVEDNPALFSRKNRV